MTFSRTFQLAPFLLSVWLVAGPAALPKKPAALAAAPAPAGLTTMPRRYEVTYRFEAPAGETVRWWIPLIQTAPAQTLERRSVAAPAGAEFAWDPLFGNPLLSGRGGGTVEVTTVLTRAEQSARPAVLSGEERALYLRAEKKVTLSPRVRALAARQSRGRRGTLAKARALFDYTVAVMRYDKTVPGWGEGDTERACDLKAGNCTDFHSLFISLARAAGIPARFVMGWPIPPGKSEGEIAGYHCWAEFFDERLGWVPVDASESAKHPEQTEYLFGRLDSGRVALSIGRDIPLRTAAGEPVNYLLRPVVEIDGVRAEPAPALSVRFKELAAE